MQIDSHYIKWIRFFDSKRIEKLFRQANCSCINQSKDFSVIYIKNYLDNFYQTSNSIIYKLLRPDVLETLLRLISFGLKMYYDIIGFAWQGFLDHFKLLLLMLISSFHSFFTLHVNAMGTCYYEINRFHFALYYHFHCLFVMDRLDKRTFSLSTSNFFARRLQMPSLLFQTAVTDFSILHTYLILGQSVICSWYIRLVEFH